MDIELRSQLSEPRGLQIRTVLFDETVFDESGKDAFNAITKGLTTVVCRIVVGTYVVECRPKPVHGRIDVAHHPQSYLCIEVTGEFTGESRLNYRPVLE